MKIVVKRGAGRLRRYTRPLDKYNSTYRAFEGAPDSGRFLPSAAVRFVFYMRGPGDK